MAGAHALRYPVTMSEPVSRVVLTAAEHQAQPVEKKTPARKDELARRHTQPGACHGAASAASAASRRLSSISGVQGNMTKTRLAARCAPKTINPGRRRPTSWKRLKFECKLVGGLRRVPECTRATPYRRGEDGACNTTDDSKHMHTAHPVAKK